MTTVLIVEDDAVFRGALGRSLRREGFSVLESEGIEAAESLLLQHQPDSAVIDLVLQDGSGIDVLRSVLRKYPHCRCVMLTAHGTIPTAVEAMRGGARNFLTKPISTIELVEALGESVTDLADTERDHILQVLENCNGNISETARRLGLHRRTLQRKLQKIPNRGSSTT